MTRKPNDITEWMLLYGEKLADAIKQDGCVGGPESDPLLSDAQKYGGSRKEAKSLLVTYLRLRGCGELLQP